MQMDGEQLDTVEYVSYQTNKNGEKTGKIIISKDQFYKHGKVHRRMNEVPPEYKKIYGYTWFTGEL